MMMMMINSMHVNNSYIKSAAWRRFVDSLHFNVFLLYFSIFVLVNVLI